MQRIGVAEPDSAATSDTPEPTTAEVRAWARDNGFTVPDRGRLRPEIHRAWRDARPS